MNQNNEINEMWGKAMREGDPATRRFYHLLRLIPSDPRCKMCGSPFHGLGKPLMRIIGRGRSNLNPNWCNFCERIAEEHPGGAEVEITMFFADVRGSTTLAEGMSPLEFTGLMNRFYAAATHILGRADAMIDKMVGDEVIGLFVPGFAGKDHARRAIESAIELLRATGHDQPNGPWLPVGAGIHTGEVYVGVVGTEGVHDITAMGDGMNTAARLVSQAARGEIVMSEAAYTASGLDLQGLEPRHLQLKGRSEPVDVRVLRIGSAEAVNRP